MAEAVWTVVGVAWLVDVAWLVGAGVADPGCGDCDCDGDPVPVVPVFEGVAVTEPPG